MKRFLAVCTVKNEGAFFLEWLAWNRIVGFTDFLIFQNDSTDGTKDLLQLLDERGLIHFIDNDGADFASPQRYSYRKASQSKLFKSADWAMALDIDEFPVISVGDGTLTALLSHYPEDADEIRMNWRNFGCSGHVSLSTDLVTERFQTCHTVANQKAFKFPTKTLFRPASFHRFGVHSPKSPQKTDWNAYDGSCNMLSNPQDINVGFADDKGQRYAALYHYIVKDVASFTLKCDRGKSGHVNREMKARYWRHWAPKGGHDDTLAKQAHRIREEIDQIDAACDGKALPIQSSAQAWREMRFHELMKQEEYVVMMRDICAHEQLAVPSFVPELSTLNTQINAQPKAEQPAKDIPPKPAINLNFSEIRDLASQRGGEFHETENYAVVHLPGKDRLLCGFDNLSSIKSEGPRKPWAFELAESHGWGMLGVMVKRNDWYQSPDLVPVMEGLQERGLFSSYSAVTMYGASMGAFGAATFARLAPGCTVVAFAPQSSLAADLAPFEKRYKFAKKITDWSTGRYRDAAEGIRSADKVYLVHDPLIAMDRSHVERLAGENTVDLRWPYLTHKIPPAFRRMKILKPMALEMIQGTMCEARFFELLRARKTCTAYLVRMLDGAADRGHAKLGLAAMKIVRARQDNWRLRQVERKLLRSHDKPT